MCDYRSQEEPLVKSTRDDKLSGGEEGGAAADPAGEGNDAVSTKPVLAAGKPEEKAPTGKSSMATAKPVNKNKTEGRGGGCGKGESFCDGSSARLPDQPLARLHRDLTMPSPGSPPGPNSEQ